MSSRSADEMQEIDSVDVGLQEYLKSRASSPTSEQVAAEASFVGKWVARRKADAVIVAAANNYDALELELSRLGIDPQEVVMGVVYDPSELFVD